MARARSTTVGKPTNVIATTPGAPAITPTTIRSPASPKATAAVARILDVQASRDVRPTTPRPMGPAVTTTATTNPRSGWYTVKAVASTAIVPRPRFAGTDDHHRSANRQTTG